MPPLLPLVCGACLTVLVNGVFLIEMAAPQLLHLPFHHCPYDLVPGAPESLVAIALFVWGSFCVGWAWVARGWANCSETRPFLPKFASQVLFWALCGYLGSLIMMNIELALV
jgi:hypothetical protein